MTQRPVRTRTPSQDVERALVDAAEAVLVRGGAGAVTVRAVAAEAKVAPMSLYNRFGGKEGLSERLLIRGFDRLRAAIAVPEIAEPISRLRASGLRYREFALANPQLYAAMFEGSFGVAPTSPGCAEHGAAAFGELVRHVADVLGVEPASSPAALETAQQMWAAVHGAVSLELKDLTMTPDPAATHAGLIDQLIRGLPEHA